MLAALCLVVLAPSSFGDEVWDDPELDVQLVIPSHPFPWSWLKPRPDWKTLGIVQGAARRLTKTKDGSPPDGLGAELHLAIRRLPDGMTLESALDDADVRGFLLKRFGEVKVELAKDTTKLLSLKPKGDHRGVVLKAKGQALDLDGKGPRRCTASLVVAIARGRLYLLRMYAFPTERDTEGLAFDVSSLERDALVLLDTTKPETPPKMPAPREAPRKPEPIAGEHGWRLVKDAKLTRVELRPKEEREFKVLKLEDRDARSAYVVELFEQPNVRVVGGVRTPATEIRDWISASWWGPFVKAHRRSAVDTWKWPRKAGVDHPTFLTLPRLDDETQRVGVVSAGATRVRSMDHDAMRRARCIEKITKRLIGKKGKVKAAYRGCLQATNDEQQTVTELRFGWRTHGHTYLLFVTLVGDAYVKWGEAIRATIESMTFGD